MEKTILNGRYELISLIGTGGMGHVYKAKDNKLDRIVAVKILKEEYLEDSEFVERFHAEAQAAAKLSHANIVAVHDVGVDGDCHFIVMELIDGVILSNYVKMQERLNVQETVSIAIQIAAALAAAHKSGIVHRDIKPHNVLLSADGIAKVADFGIAKAASARTFTLSGKTVGSVHYFSPEQARGGYVDARADIYSLGAVMYEMLVGKPPFDGETPVVVAVKHLQEKMIEPMTLNPDIPEGLNTIITKAMSKSPDDRYQTATAMLNELEAFRAGRDLPSEFNLNLDFIEGTPNAMDEMDATKDLTPVRNTADKREEYDVPLTKYRKRHGFSTAIGIMSALVLVVLLAYFGITELMTTILPEPAEYILGDYRGLDFEDTRDKLESEFNIIVEKHGVYSEEVPAGIIIAQDKEQGIIFKELAVNKIRLTVSLGAEAIVIEKFDGLEYKIAELNLIDAGLKPVKDEIYSDAVAEGQVIRTDPAEGETANPGDTVTVYVSLGPELEEVAVPDFKGLTLEEVATLLEESNLQLGGYVPKDLLPGSIVVEQVPAAGEVVYEGTKLEFRFGVPANKLLVPYYVTPVSLAEQIEPIKVVVETEPDDTGIAEIIYTQTHGKGDFPIAVSVKIPENGSSKVRVFLNNSLNYEITLYYEDYKDMPGVQIIMVSPEVPAEGTGEQVTPGE